MSKKKGTRAERDLLELFWNTSDWAAIRAPGSGSARFPSPDIIAGNKTRKIAIECKYTRKRAQYLTKEEVAQLATFSRKFNAEPWIGVKFAGKGFFFLSLDDLKETPKFYMISYKMALDKGLKFDELIGKF